MTACTAGGPFRSLVRRWAGCASARREPVQPWPGVRYCHGFTYCAPQQRKYTLLGVGKYQPMSEDCLTLNVVAPEAPADGPLPVMFFIHGGGYILGSSATPIFDGAALARRGCVYVSVNYRLGALGCMDLSALSTPEHPIDDNLFLRDLVMALRWVRDNAAVFGGDPDNVTIFGESAGAHAVATLLAVPEAKGLFAQAISESPASGMAGPPEIAAAFADDLAGVLGASAADGAAAVMAARPSELVDALEKVMRHSMKEMRGAFVVGPTFGTEFLPAGSGAGDAGRHCAPRSAHRGHQRRRGQALHPLPASVADDRADDRAAARRQRRRGAGPDHRRRTRAIPSSSACIRLGGDFAFGTAAWQIADAHGRHAPTYVYRYDYAPRTFHWSGLGATHATELFAVFDVYRTRFGSLLTAAADRRSARRVSNDVQGRWRAFSRTGLPGDGWPAYTEDDRAVMVFDRHSHLEYDPDADRRRAWEGFTLATN